MSLRGHELAHQLDEIRAEQGIPGCLVEPERVALHHLYIYEPDPFQFVDEDTLRQSSGYSTGPG